MSHRSVVIAAVANVAVVCSCASASPRGGVAASPSQSIRREPSFLGYEWRVVEIEHSGRRELVPSRLDGSISFTQNGDIGAHDGVNFLGGKLVRTAHGFRAREIVSTAAGNPGPGGAPPAALALIGAIQALVDDHSEVNADAHGNRLVLSARGYRVICIRQSRIP